MDYCIMLGKRGYVFHSTTDADIARNAYGRFDNREDFERYLDLILIDYEYLIPDNLNDL